MYYGFLIAPRNAFIRPSCLHRETVTHGQRKDQETDSQTKNTRMSCRQTKLLCNNLRAAIRETLPAPFSKICVGHRRRRTWKKCDTIRACRFGRGTAQLCLTRFCGQDMADRDQQQQLKWFLWLPQQQSSHKMPVLWELGIYRWKIN